MKASAHRVRAAALRTPTPVSRPRRARPATDRFEARSKAKSEARLSRRPPPGVAVVANRSGAGAWVLKWKDPKSGKTQYAYDTETVARQRGAMFAQNLAFGAQHPQIVERYRSALRRGEGRERIVATMIALIDQACFRPGSERSVDGHFGLTTLQAQHVRVRSNRMTFTYVGKSGVSQRRIVTDETIAKIVGELVRSARRRGPEALVFTHDGRAIRPEELNAFLPEGLTVKMFRAFHATRIAATDLIGARRTFGRKIPEEHRGAIVKGVYERVATHLGNTPEICKTNYVDPEVIRAICEGEDR